MSEDELVLLDAELHVLEAGLHEIGILLEFENEVRRAKECGAFGRLIVGV